MADHSAPAASSADASTDGSGLVPDELRTYMRVVAATGAIEQQLRSHVKKALGVSHDEFLVLCLLADQPGTTLRMTRIAELLGRPKTRLTYQVGCLHHMGLVTRESVCGDRRGIALTLTDKGRRLLAENTPALAQVLVSLIGPAQCAALSGLLAQASHPADEDGHPQDPAS
ncbi:MarR family winged helix-turn-helix transcriptional regulator [Streptomyces sp. Ru72]|uniref:MarR family winged helix-turn-helix transcriptional regulator n=1 Tax=Streptomyces sp. Ru72 TaxID=2080747 RepID=UPI000CDE0577|nr:MarR family transcriptional regulator [Streptomyces sp. Ru72]POX48117.1 MarR family transcriptional regulator [Streptomyces sp. Ru72]